MYKCSADPNTYCWFAAVNCGEVKHPNDVSFSLIINHFELWKILSVTFISFRNKVCHDWNHTSSFSPVLLHTNMDNQAEKVSEPHTVIERLDEVI